MLYGAPLGSQPSSVKVIRIVVGSATAVLEHTSLKCTMHQMGERRAQKMHLVNRAETNDTTKEDGGGISDGSSWGPEMQGRRREDIVV